MVKAAPSGADLVFQVYMNTSPAVLLYTVTIAAGATMGSAAGTVIVPANTRLVVNVTSVGTTFPGADATIQLN
jgi:hypothetical protein